MFWPFLCWHCTNQIKWQLIWAVEIWMRSELVFTFSIQKVSLVFQMQKLASLKTTFVIVDMLLFSWWCEDDFTQCFHWALSTKKNWSRVINLFIDTSSMHSRTFCKKSTKFINWLLASCFNEGNLFSILGIQSYTSQVLYTV